MWGLADGWTHAGLGDCRGGGRTVARLAGDWRHGDWQVGGRVPVQGTGRGQLAVGQVGDQQRGDWQVSGHVLAQDTGRGENSDGVGRRPQHWVLPVHTAKIRLQRELGVD